MFRAVTIGLLLCGTVLAGSTGQSSKDWKKLNTTCCKLGLPEARVQQAVQACRSSGLSVAEAEGLFGPINTAKAEHLPVDCVFLKIEEGLAKDAPPETIRLAAQKRQECLKLADDLIMAVRQKRGGQHAHLVSHTCMALESGLSAEALSTLFSRPGRFRYGRLIHTVEAGESLKLAGLTNERTLLIMNECLDRDLTGAEIFRVVDVFKSGLRNGTGFEALHKTLWVSSD